MSFKIYLRRFCGFSNIFKFYFDIFPFLIAKKARGRGRLLRHLPLRIRGRPVVRGAGPPGGRGRTLGRSRENVFVLRV